MNFPQSVHVGISQSLQHGWMFTHPIMPHLTHIFSPLEEAIRTDLLPLVFGCKIITNQLRVLLTLPVRFGGVEISDPTLNGEGCHQASLDGTGHLIDALIGIEKFELDLHTESFGSARITEKKVRTEDHQECLTAFLAT